MKNLSDSWHRRPPCKPGTPIETILNQLIGSKESDSIFPNFFHSFSLAQYNGNLFIITVKNFKTRWRWHTNATDRWRLLSVYVWCFVSWAAFVLIGERWCRL